LIKLGFGLGSDGHSAVEFVVIGNVKKDILVVAMR
jgi:hypothetical protein